MKEIFDTAHQRIATLTEEQREQFEKITKERRERFDKFGENGQVLAHRIVETVLHRLPRSDSSSSILPSSLSGWHAVHSGPKLKHDMDRIRMV